METEAPVSISMFRVLPLTSISVRNGCDGGSPRRAIRKSWSLSSPVPVSPVSCKVLVSTKCVRCVGRCARFFLLGPFLERQTVAIWPFLLQKLHTASRNLQPFWS